MCQSYVLQCKHESRESDCESCRIGLASHQDVDFLMVGACLYDACTDAHSKCPSGHQTFKYQKQIASAVNQVDGHDCVWPFMLVKCHFGSYAVMKQIKPKLMPLQHCIALRFFNQGRQHFLPDLSVRECLTCPAS